MNLSLIFSNFGVHLRLNQVCRQTKPLVRLLRVIVVVPGIDSTTLPA